MELHHGESATQHLLVDFLLLELAHEHFGEAGETGHQMVDIPFGAEVEVKVASRDTGGAL